MDYDDFTLVLPTLNEGRTVGKIIGYALNAYRGISVVVVDDGSVDETETAVAAFSRKDRKVVFIDNKKTGRKRGLTSSIIDGIMQSKTKYAIVMDADLQHPPQIVGELARCLLEGADLAVAYRASVADWALYRKIISKSFMGAGKLILFLKNKATTKDIMPGYFGVERDFFAGVYLKNRKRFVGEGYKALFDLLKCVERKSIRVCEVPYAFQVRTEGKSKASIGRGFALFRSFFS